MRALAKLVEALNMEKTENDGRSFWLPAAFRVLDDLIQHEEATAMDLVKLGLSKGTLYRALSRLRDLELIEPVGMSRSANSGRGGRPALIWRLKG